MKRVFDIFMAGFLLITLFPICFFLYFLIRYKLGTPVFFKQSRPGLKGESFEMIKFRSMLNKFDRNGEPLSDAKRLNAFGRFLRSSSLDELPELWNVLKGQMSLVGPRPLLLEYLPLYSDKQMKRHDVRPGITGWAQVNGRNNLSWENKFKLDIWYVENQSFLLDMKVLMLTIKKVFIKEGISEEGEATMRKFTGNHY